jgi:hypothetical protein
METRDHQIFELYRDAAKDGLWVWRAFRTEGYSPSLVFG